MAHPQTTSSAVLASSTVVFLPGLVLEHFDDCALLFVSESDRIITLNSAGGRLLELVPEYAHAGRLRAADIASRVASEFGFTHGEAWQKTCRFLNDWRNNGILSIELPAGGKRGQGDG